MREGGHYTFNPPTMFELKTKRYCLIKFLRLCKKTQKHLQKQEKI